MLTDKMTAVKTAIESTLTTAFPLNCVNSVLSGNITIDDLIIQIMVESCKYAFDFTAEKHSLRYYLQRSNLLEDGQRMLIHRTLKKINEHRLARYSIIKDQTGIELHDLVPKNMSNISDRLSGYEFNAFQFWEIQNVQDLRIIDEIISGKIYGKNFSHRMFRDCATEYDDTVIKLLHQTALASDKLFSSLALFVIEWNYSFDFYYSIASEMERLNISHIPNLERRCSLFCGSVAVDSHFFRGRIYTDSRMLHLREKFIHEFVSYSPTEFKCIESQYTEALVLCSILCQRFRNWFIKNTTLEDWSSVLDTYNIASCFITEKRWSNKKIRYVKEIYKETHTDFKKPDFRS